MNEPTAPAEQVHTPHGGQRKTDTEKGAPAGNKRAWVGAKKVVFITTTTRAVQTPTLCSKSDHSRVYPLLDGCAAVGAVLHPPRAAAAHAQMAARHGDVRLRVRHAHDARGLAADGGLGNGGAPGDVAGIG